METERNRPLGTNGAKLCINCRHHRSIFNLPGTHVCAAFDQEVMSPVTGAIERIEIRPNCKQLRNQFGLIAILAQKFGSPFCGPDGIRFEPKLTETT